MEFRQALTRRRSVRTYADRPVAREGRRDEHGESDRDRFDAGS
jgi:hypothetical protein